MRKITAEQRVLIEKAIENKLPIKATVKMDVSGGFRMLLDGDLHEVEAFLPRTLSRIGRYDALRIFDPVVVRIKELSEERQSVLVSAKDVLKVHIYELEHIFMRSVEVGQEMTGRVQNVTDFGAFIRIGAVDGLLHNSKMPVQVKKGQEIKVRVTHIDIMDHKVSLEMDMPPEKVKIPKPWKPEVHETIHVETMTAKKLRNYLLEFGPMTSEENTQIYRALRKRNDYGFREILRGSADWWTAFKELK